MLRRSRTGSPWDMSGGEVKGPGLRTEVALLIKVVRASLGLGNLQDGGHVIIGIDDKQLTQMEPGLTTAELASWLVYDELATTMNAYSDAEVRYCCSDPVQRQTRCGNSGFRVHRSTSPVREGRQGPRKGALYVRPRGMPSTTEIASSVEMREVLDLSVGEAASGFLHDGRARWRQPLRRPGR